MTLHLSRKPSYKDATIGALAIDGVFFCWVCEDEVREIPGRPVAEWKIPKKTAIPAGTYRITLTWSNRFKRVMPLINNVEGFDGIRLHWGSTSEHTEGCPLVGYDRHDNWITRSRPAFDALFDRLAKAALKGEPITIQIDNPTV